MEPKDVTQAAAELVVVLEELAAKEELSRFTEGHGVQSRRFVWSWSDGQLDIAIDLPCARVLSDAETQAADAAEISGAVRMAILLLALGDAIEEKIEIACDDRGTRYAVWAADGTLEDSGEDWQVLLHRLEPLLASPDARPALAFFFP